MRQKAFLQVSGYAGVEAPVIAPENIDTPRGSFKLLVRFVDFDLFLIMLTSIRG